MALGEEERNRELDIESSVEETATSGKNQAMFSGLNSIRAKVLAVVLPLIAVSLVCLFAVLEYASFSAAKNDLNQRLLQNTRIQALALSGPLWNYDMQSIRPILQALKQDPDFLMARVMDVSGEEIAFLPADGTAGFKPAYTHTLPIKHMASDQEEVIGSVVVVMHGERMRKEVIERLKQNLLILTIIMAVIVAGTVIATERTIGSPLRQLMNSIQLAKNSDIRAPVAWQSRDELGEVLRAYNEMLEKQDRAEAAIKRSEERARESEAKLRDALDSMSDGFALFDDEDRLVMFNNKFRDLMPEYATGLKIGQRYEDIIRVGVDLDIFPTSRDRREEFIRERLAAHRNFDAPSIVRLSDGRWILCTQHGTSAGGTVSVRTDITELKQREMELQMAKEDADAANQAKSRFLANMSHELRTPLNAILGFSDVLHQEMLGPMGQDRYREYAGDINTSGKHLLDLINDILDVAKIEAGAFEPNDEVLDLSDVVVNSVRLVEQRANARGQTIALELDPVMPDLRADRRAVKQVLLNLITNAVKFTPEGGRITILSGRNEAGDVKITVRDTGPGIDEKEIALVMRPFGRLESPWTQSEEGTGLGLPLSDMLMRAHEGHLMIDSIPGEGTSIIIVFPADRVIESRGEAETA